MDFQHSNSRPSQSISSGSNIDTYKESPPVFKEVPPNSKAFSPDRYTPEVMNTFDMIEEKKVDYEKGAIDAEVVDFDVNAGEEIFSDDDLEYCVVEGVVKKKKEFKNKTKRAHKKEFNKYF